MMDIARPPSGFTITLHPFVKQQLANLEPSAPWLRDAFSNICDRLKFTGHRDGLRLRAGGRLFVEADPATGRNRLALVYGVLGSELRIESIKVVI